MQSLVLATSLLLGTQNPVISSDVQMSVDNFVQGEASRVSQLVHYKAQVNAQDTFLYQARIVIQQAKKDRQSLSATETVAE